MKSEACSPIHNEWVDEDEPQPRIVTPQRTADSVLQTIKKVEFTDVMPGLEDNLVYRSYRLLAT
jgi:hypothetical protein